MLCDIFMTQYLISYESELCESRERRYLPTLLRIYYRIDYESDKESPEKTTTINSLLV